ncbi:metallophosphoesterase family protein [Candidatus Poriferisodalis sp.]|uniref:metallophosphoesterase family protein n=1 Tax=Candidatus Poriferisodalis sp. TaxID=3101277 RepID=UPI003B016A56
MSDMPRWDPYEFATGRAWDDIAELASVVVTNLLVVGDVHGEARHLSKAVDLAVDVGAGAIVQVGDFWLADATWSRLNPLESQFMWTAHDAPLPIIVVDGNHEVWPALSSYARTPAAQAAVASRRPLHLGGSIWWAWRGSVWTWGGRTFGALGGAVSPDRHSPARRGYRWDDEATTGADLDRLMANVDAEFGGSLDVLFTHDAPAQVRGLKATMPGVPWDLREAAKHGRGLLREAVERTQPSFVLHGHWHRTHRERIGEATEVFGLSADGMANSAAHLTTHPALGVRYMG